MQRNRAARSLLVSASLVIAGSAMAQTADKEPSAASRQNAAKSSPTKPAAAPRSLDFVPSGNLKETATTRATASGSSQPAQVPAKDGSRCHSKGSDA